MQPRHRRKRLVIPKETLADLFKEGTEFYGIPDDASCTGWFDIPERESLCLILQHSSFEPVLEGGEIPELEHTVNTLHRCLGCRNEMIVTETVVPADDWENTSAREINHYCPVCDGE